MPYQNAARPATARPVYEPPFDLSCGEADNPSYPTKRAPGQAKTTVIDAASLFCRAPARRSHVLVVRIGVHSAHQPYGRSRPFSLSANALDSLLDTAAQLERLP
jgi:hypothetical protein